MRWLRAMRGFRTAIAVLAAVVTTPWVLLYAFYVGLPEGNDEQAIVTLGAVCALVGLVCFVAAVPRARTSSTKQYVALLAAGAIFVAGSVAIASGG